MEEAQPLFSIIIPTYNRFKELAVCLHSLTCLSYRRVGVIAKPIS